MQNKSPGCGVVKDANRIAESGFVQRVGKIVIARNHIVDSRDAHGEHLLAAGALAGVCIDRSVRGVLDDRDIAERAYICILNGVGDGIRKGVVFPEVLRKRAAVACIDAVGKIAALKHDICACCDLQLFKAAVAGDAENAARIDLDREGKAYFACVPLKSVQFAAALHGDIFAEVAVANRQCAAVRDGDFAVEGRCGIGGAVHFERLINIDKPFDRQICRDFEVAVDVQPDIEDACAVCADDGEHGVIAAVECAGVFRIGAD